MSKFVLLSAVIFLFAGAAQATEMCMQVVTRMYNPVTKEFKTANNSCVANKLQGLGFQLYVEAEQPAEPVLALSVITEATYEIEHTFPVCPPNAKCAPITNLILKLPLEGCVDASHVTYNITSNKKTGARHIAISALNIPNEESIRVFCNRRAVETRTITLGVGFIDKSKIQIEFLQSVAK